MTDYSTLSDAEINMLVAEVVWPSETLIHSPSNENFIKVLDDSRQRTDYFDGCNEPRDAWNIIFEHNISLFSPYAIGGEWEASVDIGCDDTTDLDDIITKCYYHTNPLRAAMIVFLMMCNESVS